MWLVHWLEKYLFCCFKYFFIDICTKKLYQEKISAQDLVSMEHMPEIAPPASKNFIPRACNESSRAQIQNHRQKKTKKKHPQPPPRLPPHTLSAIPHAARRPLRQAPSATRLPRAATRPASRPPAASLTPPTPHCPGLPRCSRRPPFPRTASSSLTRRPAGSRGSGADLVKDLLGGRRRWCGSVWEAPVLGSCGGSVGRRGDGGGDSVGGGGADPGSGGVRWWGRDNGNRLRHPLSRARRRRRVAELRACGNMPQVRFSFAATARVSWLFFPCNHYMYACSFCPMLQDSVTRLPFNRSATTIFWNWMIGCFQVQ